MQIRSLLFILCVSLAIPATLIPAAKAKKVTTTKRKKRTGTVKGRRISSKGKKRVVSRKGTPKRVAKKAKRVRKKVAPVVTPAPVTTEEVPAAITPAVTPAQVSQVAPAPGSLTEQIQAQRRALRKVGAAAPAAAPGIGMIPPLPTLNEENFPDVASLEKLRAEKSKLFAQATPAQHKELTNQIDQINQELNRRGMVAQLVPLNEENFPTIQDLEQYREIKDSFLGTANEVQRQELQKQIAQIDAEIARRKAAR